MSLVIPDAQFASDFAIDKIQSWSTQTDSSAGLSSGYSITVPADPSLPSTATGTGSLVNPYGKKGLPTVTWSFDKINWYPNGGQVLYFNSSLQSYFTQFALYAACSDSSIVLVAVTGYTASQKVYIQLAVDNPT